MDKEYSNLRNIEISLSNGEVIKTSYAVSSKRERNFYQYKNFHLVRSIKKNLEKKQLLQNTQIEEKKFENDEYLVTLFHEESGIKCSFLELICCEDLEKEKHVLLRINTNYIKDLYVLEYINLRFENNFSEKKGYNSLCLIGDF